MEATDVDRLSIALASARDRERSFAQQTSVALAYLRVVLGVPNGTEITLTDPLETVLNDPGEIALSAQPLDLNSHVERQLAGTLVNLSDLEVRNQKAAYLPKLHGFFSYQQQSFGFNGPTETSFYPASLWGLQLSVPIFSSGMRSSRVKQSNFGLEQANVNLVATEQRLMAEQQERAQKAITAQESFQTEKQNMALSQRIFERTSIKFSNGMSSSFELNQDQSQYLQAQSTYLGKLVDLLLARVELRKALDLY
jgi:outer membrane protein TolC